MATIIQNLYEGIIMSQNENHSDHANSQTLQPYVYSSIESIEKLSVILGNLVKKIESLEYKLLEKDEEIKSLSSSVATLRAQNEQKDLEMEKLLRELQAYRNGINDIYNSYKQYEQENNG